MGNSIVILQQWLPRRSQTERSIHKPATVSFPDVLFSPAKNAYSPSSSFIIFRTISLYIFPWASILYLELGLISLPLKFHKTSIPEWDSSTSKTTFWVSVHVRSRRPLMILISREKENSGRSFLQRECKTLKAVAHYMERSLLSTERLQLVSTLPTISL